MLKKNRPVGKSRPARETKAEAKAKMPKAQPLVETEPRPQADLSPLQTINKGLNTTAKDFGELAGALILASIGEDPTRQGVAKTPERFSKAIKEICSGYNETLEAVVGGGIFPSEGPGLVSVQHVEFFSLCEHHILPFWGQVTVSYYPDEHILGLSKVGRLIDVFARRLQVQERLTSEIGDAIRAVTSARAVGVKIKAAHMCMMMRGIKKTESETVTECLLGIENISDTERERLLASL